MFDVGYTELLLTAMVALVVIGPKDLPKAMRFVGYWVGKARGVARQFRSGFDAMVREAELAEMEKKWAEENARIMAEHPAEPTPALPAPVMEDGAPVAVIEHHDAATPAADHTYDHDYHRGHDTPPATTEQPEIKDEPELPLGEPGKAAH